MSVVFLVCNTSLIHIRIITWTSGKQRRKFFKIMSTGPTTPEAIRPMETGNPPEVQTKERRFEGARKRFSTIAARVRTSFNFLKQSHPDINLDTETRQLDEQAAREFNLNNLNLQVFKPEGPQAEADSISTKEARVKEFLRQQERKYVGGLFENYYHSREHRQEKIQEHLERRNPMDRFARANLVKGLGAAGIQHPAEVVSVIEHNVYIEGYFDIRQADVIRILDKLEGENEQEAIRKLAVGLERFEKMHLFPHKDELRKPEFADALSTMANVSEETFQEVFEALGSYYFLHTLGSISYRQGKLVPDVTALIAILQNGGLTEDQKQKLDDENLYAHITGQIPIIQKTKDTRYPYSLSLTDALSPADNQMELYRPFVVDFASDRIEQGSRGGEIQIRAGPVLMDTLEYMRSEGKLPLLKAFLDSGWNYMGVYEERGDDYYPVKKEQLVARLEKAAVFFANEDQVKWAQHCMTALGVPTRLTLSGLDIYEALYADRERLTEVMDILAAFPDADRPKFASIVSIGGKDGQHKVAVNIQLYHITYNLERGLGNEQIPFAEKGYLHLINIILRNSTEYPSWRRYDIQTQDLAFFATLARNMHTLAPAAGRDIDYYRLPASFIELILTDHTPNADLTKGFLQFCVDPQNFSPAFAWRHIDMFAVSTRALIASAFPQDFVQTLSPNDQLLINTLKRVQTSHDQVFLWENRARVGEFFVNGIPTPLFFQTAAESNCTGIVSALLTDEVLNLFTPEQKYFWSIYRILPGEGRATLITHKERIAEFFSGGRPTAAFLYEMALDSKNQVMLDADRVLKMADINSFSPQDKSFWEYFGASSEGERNIILKNRDRFSDLVIEGRPTPTLLYEAAVSGYSSIAIRGTTRVDWEKFATERQFWNYYVGCPDILRLFVCINKDRFSEFVVEGKETSAFYTSLAEEDPRVFVAFSEREGWRVTFGEPLVNRFLNTLPIQTDEKRNAFTHNEYDRTSQFIDYMLTNAQADFGLNHRDFEILTEYVKRFGLSRTPYIFHYFKNLYLFEQGKISELPKDVIDSGMRSVQEMIDQLVRIKSRVYSEIPMTDLSGLSNFEMEMLRFITGKSTHRWDGGKPSIERIIQEFLQDLSTGSIESLPLQYHTELLNAIKVTIEFNADAIREDYEILKDEILTSIQNPNNLGGLKRITRETLQAKVDRIRRVASESEGKKLEFMIREVSRLEEYISRLDHIKDLDSLISSLLEMNFDKTEQKVISGVFRRIIFGKIFQKNFSAGFIQEIQRQLEGGISAASIESIINVVDEMAKTHALNLDGNNKEGYWTDETFRKIKGSKRGRDLPNSFSPHIGKLRKEVEHFQKIQTGASNQVRAIPDRGFVGEMSGYLADACYSAEYPLLKKYPNVIPYKFVTINTETGDPQFIGSVLVFEVNDAEGNPSLLVRAFDVPNESAIDVNSFIEQFLDKVAEVGRARGKRQVLVPGNSGAVSNYQMTINHIRKNYTAGRTATTLSDRFDFNGYDLTNDCFVARKIAA